jgi:hypothetical protein
VNSEKPTAIERYTLLDLDRLTLKLNADNVEQAHEVNALRATDEEFASFVADYANAKPGIDWSDLEERASFLSRLHAFCEAQSLPIPFTETDENLTEDEMKKLPS